VSRFIFKAVDDMIAHPVQVDQDALTAAHYLLRPFCLRRLKEEVELSLPPRVETRIACPLSDMQTFWYRRSVHCSLLAC
jgi:SNF2 family DNA or RNA helicase